MQTAPPTELAGLFAVNDIGLRFRCGWLSAITLAELVHAARCVEQHVLARVERVRLRAYFDLYERIGSAFELNVVSCLNSRAGFEFEVARQVVKYHIAVFRVNALFHAS